MSEPAYVLDDVYQSWWAKQNKKVSPPKFKNERKFGYVITNEVELQRLRKYIKDVNPRVRAFDTETSSEDDSIRKARMVGLSICFGEEKHHNFYIPCGHTVLDPYGEQLPLNSVVKFAEEFLLQKDIVIGFQNGAYDCHILANHGLHLLKHTRRLGIKLYDTMIASWLVDENLFKSLKFQAKLRLKHKPYVKEMKEYNETVSTVPNDVKRKHGLKANQKATIDLVSIDIAGDYAINDSLATFDLIPIFERLLLKEHPLHDRMHHFEMEYFYVAYKMERRGTKLNLPLLRQYKKDITKHIAELEHELFTKVGYSFSVRSPKALPQLLYNELGFPIVHWTDPKKNKSGTSNPSTGKEALETMLDYERTLYNPMMDELKKLKKKKNPTSKTTKSIKKLERETKELRDKLDIVKLIFDVRLLRHLDSNFISGLLERQVKGIIYPRFNVAGTVTGRLSSSDPNGQNIANDVKDTDPRYRYSIRDLFIARKGYKLIVVDESNLELRILAHIAKDQNLIDMFMSKDDPHSRTAIDMNPSHRLAKLGITPTELKKLAGLDKQLHHAGGSLQTFLKDNEKLLDLVDTYLYQECKLSDLKKMDEKMAMKMLFRLQKEAKDLRAEGKLLNFAIIYGFGDDAIAKALGLPTAEQGKQKKIAYFNAFKGVARWIQYIRNYAEKKGFVETLLHKRRRKPSALQASNAPIQGTAGDLVKMAQLAMDRNAMLKRLGVKQLMQIHDECVLECPEANVDRALKVVQRCMEHPLAEDLIVPLEAIPEAGKTWNECK